MLRQASSSCARATAAAALVSQTRSYFIHHHKHDMNLGKFDINRETDEQRDKSTRWRDHNMAKYRAMYWRLDEMARRQERWVQSQGYFYLPIMDFPVYKGCQPLFSQEQLRIHYGRHHRAYVDKLNALIKGSKYEGLPLDTLIRRADAEGDTAIFNNAAQHYNHAFFWKSIEPYGVNFPPDLAAALSEQYGSVEDFKTEWTNASMGHFGSGWIWLCYDVSRKQFKILALKNAGTPLTMDGVVPLLTMDAWEHAWYVDYENDKAKYVANFLKCADYHWAERNWKRATDQEHHPFCFL